MTGKTLLVAGATGIVGGAVVAHFAQRPGWQVLALSRRKVAESTGVRALQADLTDPATLQALAADLAPVTHLFYTALYEKPNLVAGWRESDQMDINRAMLANLLDVLAVAAPRLQQVTVMQGTKAYGLHDTQVPVPAKEHWPRAPHAVFYWQQEDLLRERQPGAGWTWSILRPQLILGHGVGSPMNVMAAIGAYACIQRELGEELCFPGGGRYVHAASDSRLIAQAAEFVATQPIAANQTYNIVNGDMLVWQDAWPAIAAHFGMRVGPQRPLRLAEAMPAHEDLWRALAQRHGLREAGLARWLSSSWQFTDRTFGYGLERPLDRIESPIKLWQAGFTGCADTEDALVYWLRRLQDERWLPP